MARATRIVYSTEGGDLRSQPASIPSVPPRTSERVRVRRETAGRRGKTVTSVLGLPLDESDLRQLAGTLKRRCGVGGAVKDGVIELQGDHRDVVIAVLEAEGYRPVRAGG
ncbi:translation initiation factor [Conexibacter sp. DBS9H8]|uniref:translation initiation factor n=1 Tax=Conexibacter sp. DBS9H8 TaxID=2937801 RepID=UPI00200D7E69|nr:stress response translation initiation inhibitor YciH [Conexibacter sp. DBS9H8]